MYVEKYKRKSTRSATPFTYLPLTSNQAGEWNDRKKVGKTDCIVRMHYIENYLIIVGENMGEGE